MSVRDETVTAAALVAAFAERLRFSAAVNQEVRIEVCLTPDDARRMAHALDGGDLMVLRDDLIVLRDDLARRRDGHVAAVAALYESIKKNDRHQIAPLYGACLACCWAVLAHGLFDLAGLL